MTSAKKHQPSVVNPHPRMTMCRCGHRRRRHHGPWMLFCVAGTCKDQSTGIRCKGTGCMEERCLCPVFKVSVHESQEKRNEA